MGPTEVPFLHQIRRSRHDRGVKTRQGSIVAKKMDRRVQRTQQLVRNAMLSLIQEKGFETLTVQEIIDRANIGRATFSAHFDSKDDLLVSGFEDLRASLSQRQREALSRSSGLDERVFAFSQELFGHVNDHRAVYQAMVGKDSGAVVQHVIRKLIVDLVREDVRTTPRAADSAVPTEARVQFIAGALFGVLTWWLDGEMRLSVEKVNALFRRLAMPVLKAAA